MFDGGYEPDLDTILENIREAEVVTVYFPVLRKTLLVDTRTLAGSAVEGTMPLPVAEAARRPLVRLVPMARSSAERFESVRRLRPEFDRPSSITMIPWTRRVDSLISSGVWQLLLDRLESCDCHDSSVTGASPVLMAARLFDRLRSIEQQAMREALTGAGHRTLWGRAGAGDEG